MTSLDRRIAQAPSAYPSLHGLLGPAFGDERDTGPRTFPRSIADAQSMLALVAISVAFAVLLIGAAGPDDRLELLGIPLTTYLYFVAAIFVFLMPSDRMSLALILGFLAPVALLGATLPVSLDPEAGTTKIANLLISTMLAAALLASALQRIGTNATLHTLILLIAVLLIAAVAYKTQHGFFDRQVPFLFNGPIVFARIMGLGCLCALASLRGVGRWLMVATFFAAVIWTASKGPILALLIAISAYVVVAGTPRERIFFCACLAAVMAAIYWNFAALADWAPLQRLFAVFSLMASSDGTDSIGSRLVLLQQSIAVISDHPFGVGLGSWSNATGIAWAQYPHNLLLELWTEGGLLLGSIAAVPYFLFVARRFDALWAICLFFSLSQQVSGDLLDSRYWLTFSIVGFLSLGTHAPARPRVSGTARFPATPS